MAIQFIDQTRIFVAGGRGGNGCKSMRREKYVPRGGPDGGDGGRGGSVILVASSSESNLFKFSRARHFKARPGGNGTSGNCYGASGADLLVTVPLGTIVRDPGGEVLEDLVDEGQRLVAARGGRGGRGNASLVSPANRVPTFAEKGEPGEESWLSLELKLLADVGLVGFPNVGKSTLLARLTRARPKVADYPFTTLTPHLGVMELDEGRSCVLADIPGLIEGASQGKGLGHQFLRHIERTRLTLHLVDVSGWEGRDPREDHRVIRQELEAHRADLATRPEIVVGTKLDVPGAEERLEELARALGREVLGLSAVTGRGLPELTHRLTSVLEGLPPPPPPEPVLRIHRAEPLFTLTRTGPAAFAVTGKKPETHVAMTDLANEHALLRLQRKLRRMGIDNALKAAGARDGDEVAIGAWVFVFEEEHEDDGRVG